MKGHKKSVTLRLVLVGNMLMASVAQAESYHYYNNQGVMAYGTGSGEKKRIVAQFPQINRGDLRLVANISGEQERVKGYIPDDKVYEDKEEYQWVTDGRTVLWRGKIVSNPPGTPAVDINSFQAMGRFAADKYSLYFDGQRTESNSGASKLDLATLKAVDGNSTTLVDRHNLYLLGHRQTSSENFSVLQSKPWGMNHRLYPRNEDNYSRDLLIRSYQSLFLNGKPIADVDVDTFHIIRWIPNSLLVYSDKHGQHRYSYGTVTKNKASASDESAFEIGEKTVRWRKQFSRNFEWGAWQDVPNVDPEQFYPITDRIGQYQDRLYVATLSPFGEDRLKIITLDSPDLIINRRVNVGKRHIYFISTGKWTQHVQIMTSSGPLITAPRFVYDDRYVYTWTNSQLFKTESPCPTQTSISNESIIIKTDRSACRVAP